MGTGSVPAPHVTCRHQRSCSASARRLPCFASRRDRAQRVPCRSPARRITGRVGSCPLPGGLVWTQERQLSLSARTARSPCRWLWSGRQGSVAPAAFGVPQAGAQGWLFGEGEGLLLGTTLGARQPQRMPPASPKQAAPVPARALPLPGHTVPCKRDRTHSAPPDRCRGSPAGLARGIRNPTGIPVCLGSTGVPRPWHTKGW